jgi:hypothetical protein
VDTVTPQRLCDELRIGMSDKPKERGSSDEAATLSNQNFIQSLTVSL